MKIIKKNLLWVFKFFKMDIYRVDSFNKVMCSNNFLEDGTGVKNTTHHGKKII